MAFSLSLPPSAVAREMYRYVNDKGNVVIDYRIPSEYSNAGYEVLNNDGFVVRVVPPKASAQEVLDQEDRVQFEVDVAAEQERLRRWDESLLLRYSTLEDIEAARDRTLRELRVRVSILESNTRSLINQVEKYQADAADVERSGQAVGSQQLQAMKLLQSQIAATEQSIVDRELEIEEVQANFRKDLDRFTLLLETVELRRNLSTNTKR
ncbi:MAG: hypothetical protein HOC23_18840 [Halieaceae bacterium]|nr:hypothetical protein [Halieaceae bacterium]